MPRDPRAYLQRAEEHRRHGRLKEAIALSIEALGKHPNLDAVRVTLGRAYLENAQPEEARTTLHEVFARQPSHHLAGKFLVESQRLLGDLAGAAATCRTLLEHYPRDREIEPILAEIVRAETSPETADAPPPPALKAAAPTALEDEADPQPDYLPEDLGSPRSPAPMAGTHPEAPAHVAAATAAATTPAHPAAPAPAVAPGLSTAQIDRAIEAARPPGPTPASAPKVAAAMPSPAVTPAPMAAKPAAPPRPIATAPMAPSPVVSMPTPAPPAPIARMETAASAPAAPAAAPAPAASAAGAGAAKRDALETNTLAELYVKQGLPDRAIEVYRSMLRVEPGNLAARHRLAELEAAAAAAPAPAARPASTKSAAPASPKAPAPLPSSLPAPPKSDATPAPKPAAAPAPAAVAREAAISGPPRAATSGTSPAAVPPAEASSSAPAPAAASAPVAKSALPAATVAAPPRPAHPNRAAIDRLERWLDAVKRGQKSLDGGAAA